MPEEATTQPEVVTVEEAQQPAEPIVEEQPQTETQEPQVEQHEEVADPQAEAPQAVESDVAVEETPVETPVEEEETFEIPTQQQVRPLTQADLQVNPETGDVNVDALLQTFNERINEAVQVSTSQSVTEVELKNKYEKSWAEAEAEFPELKKDKEKRDMVYAIHADTVASNKKYLSPKAAAAKLFGIANKAKAEGIEAAQESSKVQDSARLETSSQPAPTNTTNSDLEARLQSSDRVVSEAARQEKLSQLLKEGKI